MNNNDQRLARLFRAESGRLLAVLIKQCGDITLAEDALQEACLSATQQWSASNLPAKPEAWLLTVARRRLFDVLRRSKKLTDQALLRQLEADLSPKTSDETEQGIPEERLRLIFTCCHPALNQSAQVALTLKSLCGLSSSEIARAFLISETTLNQRLVRAKQKIKRAKIPYQMPTTHDLPERLDSVLSVLYLIFNESYSAYEGQNLSRNDLANEAIRLTRVLHQLLPKPAVAGLLALMLLHHSRAKSRSNSEQGFVPLEHQDRALWDSKMIGEGTSLLLAALAKGEPEQYQIQASISALHSQATSWDTTDWRQIALLYSELYKVSPTPVVELNGIVAMAHTGKLQQAIDGLNVLQEALEDYQPFYAARADLYAKVKDIEAASSDYKKAISLSKNGQERDYLTLKLASLSRS